MSLSAVICFIMGDFCMFIYCSLFCICMMTNLRCLTHTDCICFIVIHLLFLPRQPHAVLVIMSLFLKKMKWTVSIWSLLLKVWCCGFDIVNMVHNISSSAPTIPGSTPTIADSTPTVDRILFIFYEMTFQKAMTNFLTYSCKVRNARHQTW